VAGGRRRDGGGPRWPAAGWKRAAVAGGRRRNGGGPRRPVAGCRRAAVAGDRRRDGGGLRWPLAGGRQQDGGGLRRPAAGWRGPRRPVAEITEMADEYAYTSDCGTYWLCCYQICSAMHLFCSSFILNTQFILLASLQDGPNPSD
jgi:hypothetical protein